MRSIVLVWSLWSVLLSPVALAQPSHAGASLPEPISTRQMLFSIPFHVDHVSGLTDAVEVQLFVSVDRGATWQRCDRVKPEKGHFLFRAVSEGEYWFAICTLDRSGQLRPPKPVAPGLRVIVDTTLPDLRLTARRGDAGEIVAAWEIAEPHLQPDSLSIQYRSDPTRPWQTVAVDRPGLGRDQRGGKQSWWPEPGATQVEIRAEVADTAGNRAVSHAKVNLTREDLADSQPPASSFEPAARATEHPTAGWRASDDRAAPPAAEALAGASAHPTAGDDRAVTATVSPSDPREQGPYVGDRYAQRYGRSAVPSDRPSDRDPAEATEASTEAVPIAPVETSPPAASRSGGFGAERPGWGTDRAAPDDSRPWTATNSVSANVHPPIANRYGEDGPSHGNRHREDKPSQGGRFQLPTGQVPRMVNSRKLEISYSASDGSDHGPAELWGTRDGGQTWTSFGVDADRQTPLIVAVEEEGLYGFRIAPRAAAEGGKPRSGDAPDVWVGVDWTEPRARILSAEQGQRAGQILLRWEADDEVLARRPIALFYGDSPEGPWTPIASDLENTGQYAWLADVRRAGPVYLRLEVRDEAGNVAGDTSEPIWVDPVARGARIRDVRPADQSARRPVERRVRVR